MYGTITYLFRSVGRISYSAYISDLIALITEIALSFKIQCLKYLLLYALAMFPLWEYLNPLAMQVLSLQ